MASNQLAKAFCVLLLVCYKSSFTSGCGGVLLSESGWFTSPNYPNNYPNNARCEWLIEGRQPIIVSFIHLHLEKYYDWLLVRKNQEHLLNITKNVNF